MKIRPQLILLLTIFTFAFLFRFFSISNIPPHPTLDEVSIGYNAYSILKTGADEYGNKLPILLRAYDDWRPALYVYLVLPFIAFFGLDILSVRLPSVILSFLTVIAVFLLSKYLFKNSESINFGKVYLDIPILATIFFAISPWHIYISRLGHEVNAHFSFLIFGIYFFFRFLDKHKWSIYPSSVFFALSFASYQNGKIIVPLIVVALSIIFFKKLVQVKKQIIGSFLIGLLIIFPTLITLTDENSLIRFRGTNLIENSNNYFEQVANRYLIDIKTDNYLGQIFDNRKTATLLLVSSAYFSHLNPVWLFFNSGNEIFKAPNIGLLNLIESPLIFIALISISRLGIPKKSIVFILAWVIISFIPASITTGFPHAMRAFGVLPIPHFLSAIGLLSILIMFERKYKYYFLSIMIFILIASSAWFYNSYFNLLPREVSNQFQFGVIDGLKELKKEENNFDKIIVSNRDNLFQSYMFYLYLNKTDPYNYQKSGGSISGGYDESHEIGKYFFGDPNKSLSNNTLFLLNLKEYDEISSIDSFNFNIVTKSIIIDPLGKPILVVGQIK